MTAAAAAAQRAVKTELPSSSQGTGSGSHPSASLVTRRAAAAAAAAMEEDLAEAAEAAAAQHAAAAAAMGLAGGYGMGADVWGRFDHSEVLSGAGGFGRYGAPLMTHPSGMLGGTDRSAGAAGYSMAQLQAMQHQQAMQMQGMGPLGSASLAGAGGPAGMGLSVNPGLGAAAAAVGVQRTSLPGGPYGSAAAGSGAAGTGALCGGSGMLHGRVSGSAGSGRVTQQQGQGDDDAGSSSCCSSRGSPMLSGARRNQQRNLLVSAASAPSGAISHYMNPASVGAVTPLASMSSMPSLPPHVGYSPQQQQQLQAASAAAAGAGGVPGTLARSGSACSSYAAARAAAVAAAAAARNNPAARNWQAHVMMQAGGSSFDSCADIWAGQPGAVDASLAANPAAGAAGSPAGVYLMHKVGRSRMEQNPGSSARQAAAAMAGYQALQQQQQQEIEQLQLWHRIQASRQVVTALGRAPGDLAPILTSADLAAAAAMQAPTSQGLFQTCGGEVSSSINAAMAAGMHGSNAAAAAAAAAGRIGPNSAAVTMGEFYQAQMPAGISLQQGPMPSQPGGGNPAPDAAAAELVAMVNPSDLLGEMNWHVMPAEGATPGRVSAQPPAGAGAAAAAAAAAAPAAAAAQGHYAAQQQFAHTHDGSSGIKVVPAGGVGHPQAGMTAGAAAAAVHGHGLDAGDMADLWDVLEDYDNGGDKESDALFEHLTDLF